MPRVCVFDVNETLLDLGALDAYSSVVSVMPHWFRHKGEQPCDQGSPTCPNVPDLLLAHD